MVKRGIFVTDNIPEIIFVSFVDDVTNCPETAIHLQLQVISSSEFCNNTGMSTCQFDTEVMVFRNADLFRNYERWTYNKLASLKIKPGEVSITIFK